MLNVRTESKHLVLIFFLRVRTEKYKIKLLFLKKKKKYAENLLRMRKWQNVLLVQKITKSREWVLLREFRVAGSVVPFFLSLSGTFKRLSCPSHDNYSWSGTFPLFFTPGSLQVCFLTHTPPIQWRADLWVQVWTQIKHTYHLRHQRAYGGFLP